MFNEHRNFPAQPLFQQSDLYFNDRKKLNSAKKEGCSPPRKIIALVLVFFFLAIIAIVLGLIPLFIKLSKIPDVAPLRQNSTVQNTTILQESDPFSELLSSGSDFTLRSGSFDFDLSLNPNAKLVGVKDTDYEILDLRPTIPNIAIEPETSSKLSVLPQENLKEPQNLEADKTMLNTDLNAQGLNDLQLQNFENELFMLPNFEEPLNSKMNRQNPINVQQPFAQENFEQKLFNQETDGLEKFSAPRLNTVKVEVKKEADKNA